MSIQIKKQVISYKVEAVIFDLDGVITNSATIHAFAWKQLFDAFLEKGGYLNSGQELFDIELDYSMYVDGKMRMHGIDSFLRSRDILIPLGQKDDLELHSQYGLSNLKNSFFRKVINEEGVTLFEDAMECINRIKKKGIPMAVASSSKNCKFLLEKAGITNMFQIIVEGNYISENKMQSKPAPDIFLEASRLLQVDVCNAVVIEDAISGIEAAIAANMGLVIAVDRNKNDKLNIDGVDQVVKTLNEVDFY
jgi:trehalose 6-phosphate phosphatase